MSIDTMNKFLFDMSFDDGVVPEAPAAPTTVTMTFEELDAIKRAVFQDGIADGRAQAEAGYTLKTTELTSRIAAELEAIGRTVGAHSHQRHETIVTAIKAIAQNMLPVYLSKHGYEEMERLVVQCLHELRDEPRLVIRVSEGQLDASIKRFEDMARQSAFPGKLIILGEPGLADNDCRIEWADGGLERTMDTLWTEIAAIMARNIGTPKHAATATAPLATPVTIPAQVHAYEQTIENTAEQITAPPAPIVTGEENV